LDVVLVARAACARSDAGSVRQELQEVLANLEVVDQPA
jgi:RNase P protein component